MSTENSRKLAVLEPGEEIVISGISGVYPNCENISQLASNLFAKEDLITDLPEINFSVGKLKSVNKFDARFFDITNEHGEYMDPLCRILLEKTYEAITDAGYNFREFKNKNTAVFVANCTSDAEVESTFRTDVKGALICERSQSFLANRISYWLDSKGPSCTVNTACSSSLCALEFAYKAIRNEECESAIVGASNLCLSPGMIRLYKNLGITSSRCRSFDDDSVGFCRSEAISVILLQKLKNARRMYAEVVHVKTNNDGYKKQSILFPSHHIQMKLINEVYQECNVDKSQLSWVEAHGTGTRVGDYQEMKSLETLCEGRNSPLLVGCVKSNLGHTEATSGLCSIAKVIIAMECGLIPPNLHYKKAQNGIEVLQEDKIRVITEITPWSGGYVAINNFGIGGTNAHLLLKSNPKKMYDFHPIDNAHRLVVISGPTEESVDNIIAYLQSNPLNLEFIGLLHKVFSIAIPNHEFRGYTILDRDNSLKFKQIQRIKNVKRPIWFIYPGMGSQWMSMAKDLMKINSFEKSILECHCILESYGLDLLKILTDEATDWFQNILHCFVGITAVMIALTDTLTLAGIYPDGYIGHSFGEILCAYVDKCLNKTEALLTAYYRGRASVEICTMKGLMAVVGLRSEIIKLKCPPSIEIVCYNSENSCTIAGPAEAVKEMICKFRSENVFANEIYSANIAYHSSYIQNIGIAYGRYLKEVIPTPRKRSPKWISSSVYENEKHTISAKYCSSDYFVNNFTTPVEFRRGLKHVPNNAITLEISSHSILKSMLNDSFNETVLNVSLINKHNPQPLQQLFTALGTLYNNGIDMDVSYLYTPVTFPVSRGTPMISPLIKWNHSKDWYVPFEKLNQIFPGTRNTNSVIINYENEEMRYLQDCIIDGENVFPESGYLKMVWEAFAENRKVDYLNTSVIFTNVHFHKFVKIPHNGTLEYNVIIIRGNGNFEVTIGEEIIVEGYIDILQPHHKTQSFKRKFSKPIINDENSTLLMKADIYKELRINGYNYRNSFQTILSSNIEGTEGTLQWTANWILFLDGMMQFLYLQTANVHYMPIIKHIEKLEIDIQKHKNTINIQNQDILVKLSRDYSHIECGGVGITGVATKRVKRRQIKEATLQTIEFVPYFNETMLSKEELVRIVTTIVLENTLTSKVNVLEFIPLRNFNILSIDIDNHFLLLPFYKVDIRIYTGNFEYDTTNIPSNFKILKGLVQCNNNIHLMILPNTKDSFSEVIKFIDLKVRIKLVHVFDKS